MLWLRIVNNVKAGNFMNIINLIENANQKYNNKVAYEYENQSITFGEVYNKTLAVATKISSISEERDPIVVISNKNLNIPSIYLGVAYSNCFYVPVSTEMPNVKIENILKITEAKIIISDNESFEKAKSLDFSGRILLLDECVDCEINNELITQRKNNVLDVYPLYTIFTSGSTGLPKGVVTSHASVVDYVSTFIKTFNISQEEIFGNQAPLDYIAGIRDIYIPLIVGCKTVFINKGLFSTPKLLFEHLNNNKVTTICWVSPALSLCCQINVFEEIKPEYVTKVFFTGSVFDCKDLNTWKKELPNAIFVNHYGPTEITASCTYYIVDNKKEYRKPAPIGVAFDNRKVFVLTEENTKAPVGEVGEICVVGRCLALGYYKNPEKTDECFVQNPLNNIYSEKMYKTGDLGYLDDDGNIIFCGRKDNQIKHMGHRVELDEIETVACACENVKETCCVYNTNKGVITLFYSGSATAGEISKFLRQSLPSYMIPRKFIVLENLPKLFNGKIDRQAIKKQVEELV